MSSDSTPALETALYFDGLWHPSISNEWHQVRNPANGTVVGRVALACAEDVDRAVAVAQKARRGWETTHADSRAAVLHRAADLIDARKENIARTLTLEQGKPVIDSLKEINFGIQVLHYYAEEGRRVGGSLRPASATGIKNIVSYAPVGVAAAIVPWNYPVDIYCWKVGPALAAGCPIIVKPPPETPFAIGQVVACFEDAGLPPGVLGNLPGMGAVAGAALSAHPGVALISATASVAAGQDIARRAAGNLKRLSLELGGHAPFIVLPDADIEAAASAAMRRSFSNMGQICIAVNRILVHRAVHAKFVEAMATLTGEIKLGHGLDAGVTYGPTLNDTVVRRTQLHLADALAKGGRLVIGGAPPRSESLAHGSFFLPTLVDDAPLNSLPMTQETFGPLAAIRGFDSLEEMLAIANSLSFGLAAYVYTGDLALGWALAERLEFGAVGINVNDTSELQAPFGGWKLSGMGRELGPEGLHAYLEPRHLKMRVPAV